MVAVILTPSFDLVNGPTERLIRHPIYGARPLLRGRLHQGAALLSVPVGAHVIASAAPGTRVAAIAYAVTGTLMFATSAAYHRLARSVVARFWMRRLDHSMILVHIAGSTTPIAQAGIGGTAGRVLLLTSWAVAALGVVLKLTGLTAEHDPATWAFGVLGWLPLTALPVLAQRAGWTATLLLVAATSVYTVGAIYFSRKRPDPLPTIFGYHEVWHVFTLVAAALQLLLMLSLLAPAPA
jgi:hemolysin III